MVDDEAPLGLVHQREAVEGAFGPAQAEQQPQQAGRHDTRPACSPGRGGHFFQESGAACCRQHGQGVQLKAKPIRPDWYSKYYCSDYVQ